MVDNFNNVLDLEWPGFTTKKMNELTQRLTIEDDGTISINIGRKMKGYTLGVGKDNKIMNRKVPKDDEERILFKYAKNLRENPVSYHKFDEKLFRESMPLTLSSFEEFEQKREFIESHCSNNQFIIMDSHVCATLREVLAIKPFYFCRVEDKFEQTQDLNKALLIAAPRIQRQDERENFPIPLIAIQT